MKIFTSSKISNALFVFFLLLCLFISGFLVLGPTGIHDKVFQFFDPRGADTKVELVQRYLDALTNKDIKAIVKLTPRDFDVERVAQEKINQFGGLRFQDVQINYQPDYFKPSSYMDVYITGTGIDDRIFIQRAPECWYLRIGTQKGWEPIIWQRY